MAMENKEKLIEIVRNYPILYNLSHEDYKNTKKKDKIWIEIGKELNESGEEVKRKWKNLRDTYTKYIKLLNTKTGRARTNTKKWLWADQMEFFSPFLTVAKTTSNFKDIESVNIVTEELILETNMESSENYEFQNIKLEFSDNDPDATDIIEPQETYSQVIMTDINSPQSTPLPASNVASTMNAPTIQQETSRKRHFEALYSVEEMMEYFEKIRKTEYDAIDYLFLAHAKTIKTFSGRRQITTKMKIAQVIMEQELLHLDELTSTNTY